MDKINANIFGTKYMVFQGPYKWCRFVSGNRHLILFSCRSSGHPVRTCGTTSTYWYYNWVQMKRSSWRSVRRSRTHSLSSPPGKTPVWHRSLLLSSLRVTLGFPTDDATPDHKPNIWHIPLLNALLKWDR